MHVHTTASDGVLTPKEAIDLAIKRNIDGIAITDHDTVKGIEEGIIYAKGKESFILIPGIELSTEYSNEEIHILGYKIDYKSEELLDKLNILKKSRVKRAEGIVERLKDLGYSISYEEVVQISGDGVVGRPHIAMALVNKKAVQDIPEAFRKLLNKGCPAYIPRFKLSPSEAIDLIKRINGIPVLAHPGLISKPSFIQDLIKLGIEGIEVYHPDHSHSQETVYLKIANAYNLMVTGGTDFHYPHDDEDKGSIGSIKVPVSNIINTQNK